MKIVVIDGTGLIGLKLVKVLVEHGHEVIAASSRFGHVALSVVGTERMLESGYFRAKLAQENLIKSSPIPYSIVRATQFFEFIKGIVDFSIDGNTVRLPPALIQPMAADDVAGALSRIATNSPVNGIVEIGGPEQFRLDELARRDLQALQDPREVITDPHASYYGVHVSEKTLVPDNETRLGKSRFEDWLSHVIKQVQKADLQPA